MRVIALREPAQTRAFPGITQPSLPVRWIRGFEQMQKLVLVLNQEFFPLLMGNIQSLVDDPADRLSGDGNPKQDGQGGRQVHLVDCQARYLTNASS